ncbi:hypothetical protein SPRG_12627 [Saprolegnia parasitica CBS 223.65]|uniref:Ubiquitin-like domain-containing protein n=1 Tax=Saprolegnia parasitica (strain CBS 223.65) TaxID=695850 RepID=A0A067BY88_SAPPC|nr:hypothetical protein SPRG_12627 [Saprolegnia parasitica CBS 223.65]KDO21810.1 hypothetical protein SPRG_12627 [Saprolegnia parasitica CBS 223.65]|eukprot:XP_012207487.1 hypothetical protein SPRG_12627 [Saprolegnia parasitica CBS 223.65]
MEKLQLAIPTTREAPDEESKVDDARRLQEEDIVIVFELPDGSEVQEKFKKGQTIAVLKSYLSMEFDLPMESLKLLHHETTLIDPYTITDYPELEALDHVRLRVKQSRK